MYPEPRDKDETLLGAKIGNPGGEKRVDALGVQFLHRFCSMGVGAYSVLLHLCEMK